MAIYTEYLDAQLDLARLGAERKKQLQRIADHRKRDVLVYAADTSVHLRNKGNVASATAISSPDVLPITDQLAKLTGAALDLILETPGGFGEIAEQIVRLLHARYPDFAVIVPGTAKSAGTIMAMAADEILMEPSTSSLGPIDAQLTWQGKSFSAEALLKGFEKIKKEVTKTKRLNHAYVPILQAISPGDLQHAQNALAFAKELVTEWLTTRKFKTWTTHRTKGKPTYGKPVTAQQKRQRAKQIAARLCNHSYWRTHNRSITLQDLVDMRLEITDYSKDAELADAIRRYYTLLQMTFEATPIYKVFETPTSQIVRFAVPPVQQLPQLAPQAANFAGFDFTCPKCNTSFKIQANLDQARPLQPGHVPFPAGNTFRCPTCGTESDLTGQRNQIELLTKKKVVT